MLRFHRHSRFGNLRSVLGDCSDKRLSSQWQLTGSHTLAICSSHVS